MKKIQQISGTVFIILTMAAVPLYVEDCYLNMLQAKARAYDVVLGITAFLLILSAAVYLVKKSRNDYQYKHEKNFALKIDFIDCGIIILAAASLISACVNNSWQNSLFGMDGWGIGVFMICASSVITIIVPRFFEYRHNLLIPVIVVNTAIGIIAAIHGAGIDIFGMHESLVTRQYYGFMSTIGNNSWAAGYLCLVLILFVMLYIKSQSKLADIMYLTVIAASSLYAVLCGSDSLLLGMGVASFFVIPVIMSEAHAFRRLFISSSIFGICMAFVKWLPCYADKNTTYGGLFEKMMQPAIIIGIIILSVLLALVGRFWGKTIEKYGKILTIICLIIIGIVLAAYIVISAVNFSDNWGTERGVIWRSCMESYSNLPLLEKIFGTGPETVANLAQSASDYFGMTVAAAHSEFIQTLITMGIVGTAGLCIIWAGLLKMYVRMKIWEKEYAAFFIPLAAYFGQALVNSTMTTNLAVVCAVFVCFRSLMKKDIIYHNY